MKNLKGFEDAVSEWPGISVHPHRFAAKEFGLEMQKSDICIKAGSWTFRSLARFTMPSWRKVLPKNTVGFRIQVGLPFHIRSERDLTHALWLMRLSYLRYAFKTDSDPRSLLERESEKLHLGPRFRSLLEKFVPSAQNAISSSRPA